MAPPLLFSMLLMAAARPSAAVEAPAPGALGRCGKVRPPAAEPASPWALAAAEARRPTR
jgi:hypothetical protein